MKSSNRPLVDHFAHARQDYSRLSLSGAVRTRVPAGILHYYRIVELGSLGLRGERLMTRGARQFSGIMGIGALSSSCKRAIVNSSEQRGMRQNPVMRLWIFVHLPRCHNWISQPRFSVREWEYKYKREITVRQEIKRVRAHLMYWVCIVRSFSITLVLVYRFLRKWIFSNFSSILFRNLIYSWWSSFCATSALAKARERFFVTYKSMVNFSNK